MTTTQIPATEKLESAVAELVSSGGWQRFLETQSKFHNYSWGNVCLIASQRPTATRVAGYKTWQSLGRQVLKGEKGIAILAPSLRKVELDDGTTERRLTGFRVVHVFDVDQTDGEPLADVPCSRLDNDHGLAGIVDELLAHAATEGLTVERQELGSDLNGYLDRRDRRIVLHAGVSADQSFKTLVHELAHWHDLGPADGSTCDRADAEIVAESVAFVVADSLGLDTSAYSIGYVAVWAGGDPAKIRELAERVNTTARKLLAVIESDAGAELGAAA